MLNSIAKLFRNEENRPCSRERDDRHQEFCVEPLEDRRLLAGNVSAVMRAGDLVIRGDTLSNNIDVVATQGGIRVIGGPDLNGAQTTINGLSFVDFSGPSIVADDVRITLGRGQDRIGLFVSVNDSVSINSGVGSDQIEIVSAIGGNLSVNTGSADNLFADAVFITNTGVQGNARIRGGGGSQTLLIQASGFFSNTNINLGGGNDFMGVDNASGFTKLRANGGGGKLDQFQAGFPAVSPAVRGFEVII